MTDSRCGFRFPSNLLCRHLCILKGKRSNLIDDRTSPPLRLPLQTHPAILRLSVKTVVPCYGSAGLRAAPDATGLASGGLLTYVDDRATARPPSDEGFRSFRARSPS